jgi:hypothetical protein
MTTVSSYYDERPVCSKPRDCPLCGRPFDVGEEELDEHE